LAASSVGAVGVPPQQSTPLGPRVSAMSSTASVAWISTLTPVGATHWLSRPEQIVDGKTIRPKLTSSPVAAVTSITASVMSPQRPSSHMLFERSSTISMSTITPVMLKPSSAHSVPVSESESESESLSLSESLSVSVSESVSVSVDPSAPPSGEAGEPPPQAPIRLTPQTTAQRTNQVFVSVFFGVLCIGLLLPVFFPCWLMTNSLPVRGQKNVFQLVTSFLCRATANEGVGFEFRRRIDNRPRWSRCRRWCPR